MAVKLYYRINATNPPIPAQDTVLARPLSMLEIDGNMKALANAFAQNDTTIEEIYVALDGKAPINRPQFTGYIILPSVVAGSYPLNPSEGMVVYDKERQEVMVYLRNQWTPLASSLGLTDYVKRAGDIMTGKLTGTTSEWSMNIKALPPEAEQGSLTDVVATVEWVKSTAQKLIEERLTGGSGTGDDSIIINTGDMTIHRGDLTVVEGTIYGNMDMGVLE